MSGQTINVAFDAKACALVLRSTMMGLRQTHTKQEYPHALVEELLCSVYPIELAWPELSRCFSGVAQASSFSAAKENVASILGKHRAVVEADVGRYLASGFQNSGIKYDWLVRTSQAAAAGDNAQVEELEFAFACYAARFPAVVQWFAVGLFGLSRLSAFEKVFSMSFEGAPLDGYAEASVPLSQVVTMHIGGSNVMGQGAYSPLPPLF